MKRLYNHLSWVVTKRRGIDTKKGHTLYLWTRSPTLKANSALDEDTLGTLSREPHH